MTTAQQVWRRVALIPPLLLALWLLTDNNTHESERNHHLAVVTALNRHRPSLRVYRSLLEFNLLLWGTTFSLWVWRRTLGNKIIGYLLFQPAIVDPDDHYEPLVREREDDFDDVEGDILLERASTPPQEDVDTPEDQDASSPLEEQDEVAETDLVDTEDQGPVSPDSLEFEPPTVESVAKVAADTLLLILLSLFFFTFSSAEGGAYVDGMHTFKFIALIAAPVFPLALFISGVIRATLPWRRRKEFWTLISITMGAPVFEVTFRDGFIGDIITSMVRPLQDTAFTVFYFVSGLQGWWSQSYDIDAADRPLESNWLLHTCILPMCMASPLWWRFCQNLRQSFDNKQRWPYLGNATKYFVAAQVAVWGVFNPKAKSTTIWLACFVLATLYQIWWDIFMDWELLTITGRKIRLRHTRIYSRRKMYWAILIVNIFLRFCWTLSFIPSHYLTEAGVLSKNFDGDISSVLNPIIASAEIIRRTLWGLLRVEMEAIKVGRRDAKWKAWEDDEEIREAEHDGEIELQEMKMEGTEQRSKEPMNIQEAVLLSDMSNMSNAKIIVELSLWATAFTGFAMLAAHSRGTQ